MAVVLHDSQKAVNLWMHSPSGMKGLLNYVSSHFSLSLFFFPLYENDSQSLTSATWPQWLPEHQGNLRGAVQSSSDGLLSSDGPQIQQWQWVLAPTPSVCLSDSGKNPNPYISYGAQLEVSHCKDDVKLYLTNFICVMTSPATGTRKLSDDV